MAHYGLFLCSFEQLLYYLVRNWCYPSYGSLRITFFATILNPLLGWGNEVNHQVYVLGVYYILLLHFHNVFIKKKEAKKKKKNCSSTYVCLLLRTDIYIYICIIMYTREVNDMKNGDFSLFFGS